MNVKRRTWILLRGLGREKGHWGPFSDQFAESFADDDVLQIDLPGTGEFRSETSPPTIDGILKFVRAKAIERASSPTNFYLVAVSLGGMVALEWMRSYPQDLGGCVLINTSVKSVSPFYQRLRWQIWKKFVSAATITVPRERERALAEILITSPEAREQAVILWARLASESPISFRVLVRQMWAAANFKWKDPQIAVPTLVLCGLGDKLVDPACSIGLAQNMNWPIEKHPWAGHDLTWDDPSWVLQKIRNWSAAARRGEGLK